MINEFSSIFRKLNEEDYTKTTKAPIKNSQQYHQENSFLHGVGSEADRGKRWREEMGNYHRLCHHCSNLAGYILIKQSFRFATIRTRTTSQPEAFQTRREIVDGRLDEEDWRDLERSPACPPGTRSRKPLISLFSTDAGTNQIFVALNLTTYFLVGSHLRGLGTRMKLSDTKGERSSPSRILTSLTR